LTQFHFRPASLAALSLPRKPFACAVVHLCLSALVPMLRRILPHQRTRKSICTGKLRDVSHTSPKRNRDGWSAPVLQFYHPQTPKAGPSMRPRMRSRCRGARNDPSSFGFCTGSLICARSRSFISRSRHRSLACALAYFQGKFFNDFSCACACT
jgi:hypothetical protein